MRLLFIDTETGGLNPREDALLSVGLVVWEDGKVLASRDWKIKSGDKNYCISALNINNIDIKEHNSVACEPEVAAFEIIEFIDEWFPTKAATLAGHNVSFDRDFLQTLIEEYTCHEFGAMISHRLCDTMSILNFIVACGKLPPEVLSSDGAFKYFGIAIKDRHTALGDAEGTVHLFNKLSEFLKRTWEVDS